MEALGSFEMQGTNSKRCSVTSQRLESWSISLLYRPSRTHCGTHFISFTNDNVGSWPLSSMINTWCPKYVLWTSDLIQKLKWDTPIVIWIYRQSQQFVVFNNAQQCYTFRSVRPSSGTNVNNLRKNKRNTFKYIGICEIWQNIQL